MLDFQMFCKVTRYGWAVLLTATLLLLIFSINRDVGGVVGIAGQQTIKVSAIVVGKLPAVEASKSSYDMSYTLLEPYGLKVRYTDKNGVEHIDTVVVEPVRFARTNIGDRMAVEIPVPR